MIKIIFKDEIIRQFRIVYVSDDGTETEIKSGISVEIPDFKVGHLATAIVEFVGVQVVQE